MLNVFIYQGKLTAPARQKYDNKGNPYITFRLACRRNYRSIKQTDDFISFQAKGKVAENFLKYCNNTGQSVIVIGSFGSGYRSKGDNQVPVEYKNVSAVYFDRTKEEPGEAPDPKLQEILDFISDHDGFDEEGVFQSADDFADAE